MKKLIINVSLLSVIGLLAGICFSCVDKSSDNEAAYVKLLASFEDGQMTPFTSSESSASVVETPFATNGKKALKMTKGKLSWTNINQNWADYDFFMMDACLDGEDPMNITIELLDKDTESYYTTVNYSSVLKPGKNTFKVALMTKVESRSRPGRRFQNEAITQVNFSMRGSDAGIVYVDNVRLEKDPPGKMWFSGLQAFSFGDAGLPLLGGFTRVTQDCNYSASQGYGWKEAQLTIPLDPFQPDNLYRSVIYISKGDFVLDIPNGKYGVFMNIDAPTGYWGEWPVYRNRRVLANGKEVVNDVMNKEKAMARYFRYATIEDLYDENVFDKYVTPHYQEKEFEVEVTDGKLTFSFLNDQSQPRIRSSRSDNGSIALSALIIYPANKQKEAKKYLAELKERRRADFDNLHRKVLTVDKNAEPTLNDLQRKRGYVVFSRTVEEDIFPDTKPQTQELTDHVSAVGAAGTVEPITFAIRSYKNLGQIKVTASDFKTDDGKVIPSKAIQVGYISNRLARIDLNGSRYTVRPRYLMNTNETTFPENITRWFWAVFDVPETAGKGVYKGEFTLDFGNGEKGKVTASFDVIFNKALPKMDFPVGPWGMELSLGMWFPDEMRDMRTKLNRASLEIMRKTGFTTFTGGLNIQPTGSGKALTLNFGRADTLMDLAKAYGMKAFVNYGSMFTSEANGNRLNVYGYPIPTDPKDFGFDSDDAMWKHIVGLIDRHAQEKQWLPVFVSTCDEPHVREHQMTCQALNRIFKKYSTPRLRFAGITSLTETYNRDFGVDFCSAMDVANLNLHDEWAIGILKKANTGFAFYNGGNRWTFGHYMFMLAQKHKILFRVAWHWNINSGNPYFALDGREDDFCWVNTNANGELITSLNFERLRRGIVDYRYMLALKDFVAGNPNHPVAKEAQALIDEVLALRPSIDRGASGQDLDKITMQRVQEYRNKSVAILKKID